MGMTMTTEGATHRLRYHMASAAIGSMRTMTQLGKVPPLQEASAKERSILPTPELFTYYGNVLCFL